MEKIINKLMNCMFFINEIKNEFKILPPEAQQKFILKLQKFTYNIVDFAEENSKKGNWNVTHRHVSTRHIRMLSVVYM